MKNKKNKLSWKEIEKQFNKEWVQLIDFDWPEEEPLPRAGIVYVHAKTRKKFDDLILQNPPPKAALVYVGERKLPAKMSLSACK